jgi:hypothetical protein
MKKFLVWIRRHKKTTVFLATVLALAAAWGILTRFVAFAMPSGEAYTTFAYAADAWAMRHADEMIITTAGGSTVITDQALIREMADYTVVSNHIGTRCFAFGDNCIEIYRGERLVRSMPQSSWVDGCWGDSPFAAYRRVEIFENDARHRITGNKQAYAHLPVEYLERLEAELNRQGNSFFPEHC